MLHIITNPGSFGQSEHHEWRDGEPIPEALESANVADFRADSRELELIVSAMGGGDPDDDNYGGPNPPGPGPELPGSTVHMELSSGTTATALMGRANALAHQLVGFVLGLNAAPSLGVIEAWPHVVSLAEQAHSALRDREGAES